MNKKIIWIDCETGGTNDKTDALLQLSAIIEMGGVVIDSIDLKMKPLPGKRVSDEALKVQGRTLSDIETFEDPCVCYDRFYKFLQRELKSKTNRFVVGGYNAEFDLRFISQWFQNVSCGPYAFWDYLQFSPIDLLPMLRSMRHFGIIDIPDTKLETVCKYFGVEISAHDSMSDIQATRTVTHLVMDKIRSGWKM